MSIILGGSNLHIESHPFSEIPEIKRTQNILMFLISVLLSICAISFMTIIYSLSINYQTHTYEPIIILYWILFFASGMFMTDKYYPKGLFIFALLGILNLILTCILIVCYTVGIVIITSQSSKEITDIPFAIIPMIVCLISIILDAVVIIFSFKLSHLIMKKKQIK